MLVAQFPTIIETQPELVAQHYTEAGLAAQAVEYWQRAGQRACRRSANLEAVQHLSMALSLLATLPETSARAQQELDLQIALQAGLDGRQGLGRPGSGADLWSGAGVVHPARRDVAALSDPVGLMALLSEPRGAPDRA